MQCSSPLKGYYFENIKTEYGNKKIFFLKPGQAIPPGAFPMDVNCGHCIECRINKAQEWSTRCVLESYKYESNWFVTLTYDDDTIPLIKSVSRLTGKVGIFPTLQYEHIQKFMKDLRRYYSYHFGIDEIRFLCAGEYGEKTGRAHFHLLLFNLPIDKRDLHIRQQKGGHIFFDSPFLRQFWPYGNNLVTDLNLCTSAYVARYVLKKFYGQYEEQYQTLCIHEHVQPQPAEFIRMSRRPGIASDYFHNDFSCNDFLYAKRILFENGKYVPIPNYFKRIFKEHPEEVKDYEEFSGVASAQDILDVYSATKQSNFELIKKQIEKQMDLNFDDYSAMRHDGLVKSLRKRDFCS